MKSVVSIDILLTALSLTAAAVLVVGCSGSNNDSSEPLSDNDKPFSEPDPNGTTTIARLGYSDTRDLADDLVSMSYLRRYYELDRAISSLLQGGDSINEVTIDCPDGGTARGVLSVFSFDVVFDNCQINGRTLSGGLARDASFVVFGLGSNQDVSVSFDKLTIDAGEAGLVELTGVSTRDDQDFAIIECSGSPAITHRTTSQIDSARIEQGSVQTMISTASWQQSVVTEPQLPVGDPSAECLVAERLIFEGVTMAMSPMLSDNAASIEKRGDITRGIDVSTDSIAMLSADFRDNSSLALTTTSDTDSEIQVDIASDGTVISFIDDYRFEARRDIPPVLGE